jgi:Dolichyl-phosphate-mannose-protein mannosyltransferase
VTPAVSVRQPARPAPPSPSAGRDHGARLMRLLVCAAVAAPIVAYLWLALHRVGYPFELDWMEGGSVELTARVAAGHSIYATPSLGFVGWTYPPLYYWITAGVAKLIGIGFLPLRLVSLTASLVSMATLAWIVIRETGNRIAGLVAAGLFAATFRISGAWFDTGRVDSLFLALTLLTVAWGRWARGVHGGVGLGMLAFLACFTKQTALLALLPALVFVAVTRRRVGVPALLTLLGLVVASTAVLDAATHGWYGYYVFSELAHQPWARQVWLGFWRDDILHRQWPLLILLLAGAVTLTWHARRPPALSAPPAYYAAAAAGLIISAWISRLHTGGYENVLMPAYAAIALLAGLTYAGLIDGPHGRVALPLLGVALGVQLGLLVYPIGAQIPTAADRAVGAQLIARLRALPGPVIVIRHPWYATQAGKGTFAQAEAIDDVLRSASTRGARALRASLRDALDTDNVQAVVLDGPWDARLLEPELTRDFRLQTKPITTSRLYPLTDVRTAPTLLYLRIGRARQTRPREKTHRAGIAPVTEKDRGRQRLGKTWPSDRPRHSIARRLA